MRRPAVVRVLALSVLTWCVVRPAGAQIVEVPEFAVGGPTFNDHLQGVDVAVGTDGTLTFIWGEWDYNRPGKAAVRRFSALGAPLGPALRADVSTNVFPDPVISSDTRGGYVVAWPWIISGRDYEFFGRFLDGTGAGVGDDFEVDLENMGPTAAGAAAGLPSGAVFVWRQQGHLWGRLYDTGGQPRGAAFVIGDEGAGFNVDVDRMPDGGFVAAWTNDFDPGGIQSWGRVYGPDGTPRGAAFPLHPDFWVDHVAASSGGGLAATGVAYSGDTAPFQYAVWVRRFTDDGVLLSEDRIEMPERGIVAYKPDLAFDDRGDLYLPWGEYIDDPYQIRPVRARAYDPNGVPLGPPFPVTDGPATGPRAAWLHDSSFVTAWVEFGEAQANVISLCTPGVSTCGDGVLTSQCEQCDAGSANSDTVPDACRTDCRLPRCGDGVVDTNEECDDGNTRDGDCCSSACRIEVDTDGDGICDPGDNCPIFPNPDQTHPEVCTPEPYDGLSGADLARFEDGLGEFADIETVDRGLGPIFNGSSCAECHNQPTIGGSSTHFVTRFGRYDSSGFDPMTALGGTLMQAHGISTDTCSVPGEVVPPAATVVTRRDTPPLFGLGLVDAIPDASILHYADPTDRNHDGISGRPNMVGGRVGRFGWKAQVATLHDFAGEAYLNEMGITSPAFPAELNPQGGPVACDTVTDPEDDGSNVAAFADFMTLLAPLPTGPRSRQVMVGRGLFRRIKCSACHLDKLRTGASPVTALNNRRVRLFSDLLLHDMGALGDGIEQGEASGNDFRTAPLWGVARSAPYLHDGRAATLDDAIAAHAGEGQAARDHFLALSASDRAALVAYLNAL